MTALREAAITTDVDPIDVLVAAARRDFLLARDAVKEGGGAKLDRRSFFAGYWQVIARMKPSLRPERARFLTALEVKP